MMKNYVKIRLGQVHSLQQTLTTYHISTYIQPTYVSWKTKNSKIHTFPSARSIALGRGRMH